MVKRFLKITSAVIILFAVYVLYVNKNSGDMTIRQKVLKAVYPAFMWLQGNKAAKYKQENVQPKVSFYSLAANANNGKMFSFEQLRGKKVLLVNTASDCGYTGQYDELQQLHERFKDKLVIIGFPANDFKEQEKGTDEEIAQFCKINFGVTFPLMKKSSVVKGAEQNPVFRWLTDASQNGWNNQQPKWNFSKYLVNEKGELTNYFDPGVSPMCEELIKAIE